MREDDYLAIADALKDIAEGSFAMKEGSSLKNSRSLWRENYRLTPLARGRSCVLGFILELKFLSINIWRTRYNFTIKLSIPS